MFATSHNYLALVTSGVFTGLLGALLGIGGGVFLIPLLVLFFDVPMHYAVATGIISVIATSSSAASSNVERGTANMPLGMALEIATVLGAVCGGVTASFTSARMLEGLFAGVMLPTAFAMWRGRGEDEVVSSRKDGATDQAVPVQADGKRGIFDGSYFDDALGREVSYRVERLRAGLGVAFLAGNISGLLGIGGGPIKVPAMHLLCKIPMKAAAATSNFMIGVTAAASAFLYYGRGDVRPALTSCIVLGVLMGTNAGLSLNRRVEGGSIRKVFAFLLLCVAGQMLYRAVRGG